MQNFWVGHRVEHQRSVGPDVRFVRHSPRVAGRHALRHTAFRCCGKHPDTLLCLGCHWNGWAVSKEVVIRVIESAARVPSDEIKTRVLAQAIGASLVDPQVRTAFQKALESIQSDGEYRRLMSAMSKSGAEAH